MLFRKNGRLFQLERNAHAEEANDIANKSLEHQKEHDSRIEKALSGITDVIANKENDTQSLERLIKQNEYLKRELDESTKIISYVFSNPKLQYIPMSGVNRLYFEFDEFDLMELTGLEKLSTDVLTKILMEEIKIKVRKDI